MGVIAGVLNDAADLISGPDAWTQFAYARTPFQKEVFADEPNATCWCIEGAIHKATRDVADIIRAKAAIYEITNEAPHDWNDRAGRTQQEAVSLLRAAASKLEECYD